ncbi:pyruvate kinase [Ornithinimicrobium cryptoxanthini]|uniref:Pyruvate kinase n=1 Tax=Ornithinimicrobium cryptoxanthini TaxID=2934161 RepID=A0ABY4YDY1_9MICO|nr:pyruvate kinase [Ornithinimicrobium cryptoxanthini]USQ74947.1 pyruvate kinase [Ornithinimicrobium cryptoxanthini]
MRRAKIVCTLGPATDTYEGIRALVGAGMDVARMNMSHGNHEDHDRRYHMVRQAGDEMKHAVAVLADLQGPKIRTGTFADGPIELVPGASFTITVRDVPGDQQIVGTTYDGLAGDVQVGDDLLIDDGKVQLKVIDVTDTDVVTTVVIGGAVSDNKGINLPGTAVSVPALSEKDAEDLRWALRTRVDVIALSFVRSGKDIEEVHRIMDEEGMRLPVIAKIEKPQAVENLDDIVAAFDGIMVARGDLGVELPLEAVPLVQKEAIEVARRNAKPVIVATQVLESMITNPRPTRAEASDCANAVLDGADAIMLSGETSVGAWPIKAVETMATIIEATEEHGLDRIVPLGTNPHTTGGAVTKAAAEIAELLDTAYMVTFTQTGDSARRMARLRSKIPMMAFTPVPATRSQLAMTWGVETFLTPMVEHTDEMVLQVDRVLVEQQRCQEGELIVVVAGSPPGTAGATNALRLHRVGDAVYGRAPAYRKILERE